jgi:hypothetical protein
MKWHVFPAILLLISVVPARGQIWNCGLTMASDREPTLFTLEVRDKKLIQTLASGTKITYEIAQNNLYGLVAVSTISAIEAGQTKPTVGVSGIVIDRATKEFWITAIVAGFPPAANKPANGKCIIKP